MVVGDGHDAEAASHGRCNELVGPFGTGPLELWGASRKWPSCPPPKVTGTVGLEVHSPPRCARMKSNPMRHVEPPLVCRHTVSGGLLARVTLVPEGIAIEACGSHLAHCTPEHHGLGNHSAQLYGDFFADQEPADRGVDEWSHART